MFGKNINLEGGEGEEISGRGDMEVGWYENVVEHSEGGFHPRYVAQTNVD